MAVFRPRRQHVIRHKPVVQRMRRRWVPGGAYGGIFDLGLVTLLGTSSLTVDSSGLSPSVTMTATGTLTARGTGVGMSGDAVTEQAPYNPASATERA